MTITYQHDVASGSFRGFTRLLFKWRGSVYKLIYKELFVFGVAYAVISIVYRTVLEDDHRHKFEMISMYCSKYIDMIPLSFVLGFYVTFVVQRWWTQFISIPWPDKFRFCLCGLMNTVILYVDGSDERGRFLRRTLMRYWNLSFVLMMATVSSAVKKRFPTLEHIVRAGFMTEEELDIYNSIKTDLYKGWIPMNWFISVLAQVRKEGRTKSGASLKHVLEELNELRNNLRLLWCHDWVTLPLVYTQVVTWATHLFFVISLVGRQFLDTTKGYKGHEVDLYVPFFTIIQFLFYMGWLKVAEQLINPFGQDDDDVECNWLVDRHIQVSYLGVDEVCNKMPPIPDEVPWESTDQHPDKEPEDNITQFHVLGQCFQEPNDTVRHQRARGARNMLSPVFRSLCQRRHESPKRFRTLGNRKYLLTEEVLAALNSGRQVAPRKTFPNSDDSEIFAKRPNGSVRLGRSSNHECVVQIEIGDQTSTGCFNDTVRPDMIRRDDNCSFTNRAFLSDEEQVTSTNNNNNKNCGNRLLQIQSRSLPCRMPDAVTKTSPTCSSSSSFPRGEQLSVRINVDTPVSTDME